MNRLRLTGLILAILALGGVFWSLVRSDVNSDAAPSLETAPPASDTLAGTLAPVEVTTPKDRESVPPPVVESQSTPRAPIAPAQAVTLGALELSGTITALDERGLEHGAEDGHFQLVLWKGTRGDWHRVDVFAGRWSTSIPDGTDVAGLGLEDISLGGRTAVAIDGSPERFAIPPDHRLDLRVRWALESLLHVRDRASGRELEHVHMVEVHGWPTSELGHPGDEARHAKDLGASPLKLPALENGFPASRVWYATSPGYGWGRIEIDEERGGERFLLLDPGGELEIRLVGSVDDPNAVLRLYAADYHPHFEVKLGKRDLFEVGGIPVGEYRLTAQIGDYWDNPLPLGEAPAVIVANGKTRVVLTLQSVGPPARVSCAGTLIVPSSWELGDFTLDFELLGTALGGGDGRIRIQRSAMQHEESSPALFHWSIAKLQPGRYEVALSKLAFSVGLDVPAEGLSNTRIEVPAPTWVEVRCVDDATGEALENARVDWRFRLPEGVDSWSSETADWDGERRCFRFRAPIGAALIAGNCPNYARASAEYELVAGSNSFELRLRKLCSLRPILRDGDTVIPLDHDSKVELVPAEGQENYYSMSSGGGSITLHRLAPGLYTLKIPQFPGYQPVPDQTVRLEQGVVVEHVVQLVRTP